MLDIKGLIFCAEKRDCFHVFENCQHGRASGVFNVQFLRATHSACQFRSLQDTGASWCKNPFPRTSGHHCRCAITKKGFKVALYTPQLTAIKLKGQQFGGQCVNVFGTSWSWWRPWVHSRPTPPPPQLELASGVLTVQKTLHLVGRARNRVQTDTGWNVNPLDVSTEVLWVRFLLHTFGAIEVLCDRIS